MNQIPLPEDVIHVVGSFYRCNEGDESSTNLILNIGAELLDVSADELLNMIHTCQK